MASRTEVYVRLLGPPAILVNGDVVQFPSRKAQALCFFLAAHGAKRSERGMLADLLWGKHDAGNARTSLRKALSTLRTDAATKDLIDSDRPHAWFAGDPTRSDLATFYGCVAAGTERAYKEALQLWRGPPLQGLDLDEGNFEDWIATYRSETIGLTTRMLNQRLAQMRGRGAPASLEIALCELIARIDPADPEANERLIKLYADRGQAAFAARHLRTYDQALQDLDPDLRAPRSLLDYVIAKRRERAPEPVQNKVQRARPSVAIVQPRTNRPGADLFSFTHAELVHQLSRFRTMRTYERENTQQDADGNLMRKIGFTDALDHDYRLLLWDEPDARAVYVRVVNVRQQSTVSCDRIEYEALADRGAAELQIGSVLNGLEQDVIGEVGADRSTAFARWVEAYKLMTQWSPVTDRLALGMLEDLAADNDGRCLSLVHSSIASVLMIRRLVIPSTEEVAAAELERARTAAITAMSIDELDPFNHIIMGWLRIQTGDHDRALQSFDAALALNPYSSRMLITTAEANAYCGNIERAQELAARAVSLAGRYQPAYYENYRGNIAYLSGDLNGCIEHLRRGPENAQSAMMMVAAQSERGDAKATAAARVCFERELRRTEPRLAIDATALSRWIVLSNMAKGDAAKQRLFGSLERAGIPVAAR